FCFFFSSRRRHTRSKRDWSSDVCSSDLHMQVVSVGLLAFQDSCASKAPGRNLTREASMAAGQRSGRRTGGKIYGTVGYCCHLGRSEERRVGKERGCGWGQYHYEEKWKQR